MNYDLIRVTTDAEWRDYHLLRRMVLWDARGREGYDYNHPDDTRASNHALLLTLDREAIGTIRIDDRGDHSCVIRLVCIAPALQRHGHGRAMLRMADEYALQRGWPTLKVNAAVEATDFYAKLGWTLCTWDQAELDACPVPCVQMIKDLHTSIEPRTPAIDGAKA